MPRADCAATTPLTGHNIPSYRKDVKDRPRQIGLIILKSGFSELFSQEKRRLRKTEAARQEPRNEITGTA